MSVEQTAENIEQLVEAQAEEINVEGPRVDGDETQEGAELDKRKSKARFFYAA